MIHTLELLFFPKLNLSVFEYHGKNELNEYLMVEVLDEKMGVVLAFLDLHASRPVGVEQGKHEDSEKNEEQARIGEVFDQPERLGFFFQNLARGPVRFRSDTGFVVHGFSAREGDVLPVAVEI